MTESTTFAALFFAAASIGALHAVVPDHWLPVAVVSRARGYGAGRTAALTLLCGGVHLGVSALLGVLAGVLGATWVSGAAERLASMAGFVVIAGGLTWLAWGLHRAMGERWRQGAPEEAAKWSVGGLMLFFALDACVALVPISAAAVSLGGLRAVAVLAAYGAATLGVMLALAVPAQAGLRRWSGSGFPRWGHAWSGGTVAAIGLAALLLGV